MIFDKEDDERVKFYDNCEELF